MPRFYFDTKNDEQLTEDDAFEFATADEAGKEAIRYLAEAAVNHVSHLTPSLVCTVKDEQKRALISLKLSLEIVRTEDVEARAAPPARRQVVGMYASNPGNVPPDQRRRLSQDPSKESDR